MKHLSPRNRIVLRLLAPLASAFLLASCTDLYYYGPMGGGTQYLEGYNPRDPRYAGNQRVDTSPLGVGMASPACLP